MTDALEKKIENQIRKAVTSLVEELRQEDMGATRRSFSATVDALVLTQVQRTAEVLGMNYYEAYEEAFRMFLRATRTHPAPTVPPAETPAAS